MAKRILLHVGAPKTGTSYLESIIWSQRDRLLEDGTYLPGNSRKVHDALMGDVRGGVWKHRDSPRTWDRLAAEARERDDIVLVSKEMLSGASAEQAAHAIERLAPMEVHLIVTARHLAGSLPSSWQQGIKARARVPFSQWLDDVRSDPEHGFWRHQDPLSIIRRWAPGFPADRVHVITMPKNSSDPVELWRRFATVIGVDPEDYETPPRPKNESLGAVEIELLRRVNVSLGADLPMREPYLDNLRKYLTRPVLMTNPDPVKFGVPAKHADWMGERGQQMIEELRAYPCQIVGDLDDLLPTPVGDRINPDDVPDEEIAQRAVDALARILVNRETRPHSKPTRERTSVKNPPPADNHGPRERDTRQRLAGAYRSVRHRLKR